MTLKKVIHDLIPHGMLERVVMNQGVLSDDLQRSLFKASGLSWDVIIGRILDGYGDRHGQLAHGLYMQICGSDPQAALLLFEHAPEIAGNAHQASLVSRVPTLSLKDLDEFTRAARRHVCLIVVQSKSGASVTSGTGFLIAPDLILTCHHVVKDLPVSAQPLPDGARIQVFFDFQVGEPVTDFEPPPHGARLVTLANQWIVASSTFCLHDGHPVPDADQAANIAKSFDFAVLKLSEPVGLQPLSRAGGQRRGWVEMPADSVPQNLQSNDWIIIPQHPNGFPQRIDLGRYAKEDHTKTRIWYSTNTAPGTSGAPCFNQRFKLVGLHNAHVGPKENPLFNQAVRFDHVKSGLGQFAQNLGTSNASVNCRWSVARDDEEPRVILGRQKLLEWLATSVAVPRTPAQRVYAVEANTENSGCSFSIDVLLAETRDEKVPRAIYGHRGQQLPHTVEDFVLSLLRELGIDESEANQVPMPTRPTIDNSAIVTGTYTGEVDKLERWLSVELPAWFSNVLTRHLEAEFDVQALAKATIANLEALGQEVSADLRKTVAAGPMFARRHRWDVAYVVIDDLRSSSYSGNGARTEFSGEVYSFIAALVRGKSETSIDDGLTRLRWMFLGYLPDFLSVTGAEADGATLEVLDPKAVGTPEVVDLLNRLSSTYFPLQDGGRSIEEITALVDVTVKFIQEQCPVVQWLPMLQRSYNGFSSARLKRANGENVS
jgi:hypothetical protein